ncbi:MAG: molybdopterin-synthase adenylyltransferase MoeB [Gemmatimonas sp.]
MAELRDRRENDERPTYLHSRYARQHVLREFGVHGQEKLSRGRVLIVGVGGLGSPAAMYLAAAGVGTLGLADVDVVDESNLHRQLLYGVHDVGANKLDAAQQRLRDINPLVNVQLHHSRITSSNAVEIISQYDIVLDGTDNFPARYAINDACVALGIPFVYGSVARFEGQVSVFAAPDGPCYRCLFAEEPLAGTVPSCAEDGVLGILPGIVGLHQSTEVIKWLTGLGRLLVGRLLMLDLLDHSTSEISLARDPVCVACGDRTKRDVTIRENSAATASGSAITEAAALDAVTGNATIATQKTTYGTISNSETTTKQGTAPSTVSSTAPPLRTMPENATEIDVAKVAERLRNGEEFVLLDVREPWEFELAQLPNAVLVPLSNLPSAVSSLESDREYVVYCHHGMRSAMAANWLKTQGFERVYNMTGGIDAWSVVVDRSVPQY